MRYTDAQTFPGAFRLHDLLWKRLRMPLPVADRTVRALNRAWNPTELDRRRKLDGATGTAVPWRDGYLRVEPERLPGLERVVEGCAEHYRRIVPDRDEAARLSRNKPFLVTLCRDGEFAAAVPDALSFLLSPELLAPVCGYFESVPRLSSVRLWWSPPNTTVKSSQRLHVDPEDDRQLKLFVNILNTAEDQGPLTFFPADVSEAILARTPMRKQRLPDEALDGLDPPPKPVVLTGPAGTAALVDTSRCLHYGSRGNRRDRVVLMAQYTDFHAPRVPPIGWAEAVPSLDFPLTELQALVLGLKPR